MGGVFISHSSKNNNLAESLHVWLVQSGWAPAQIFLDTLDLKSGDRWREILDAMAEKEAVIVCISDEWLASAECVREFTQAQERGKPIFPVRVAEVRSPIPRFISDLQIGDTSEAGLRSLYEALLAKRVAPQSFAWPPRDEPTRSVYRGLQALETTDAAIFFGRDAAISRALDDVRRMRAGLHERLLVILGASGSGKSSFLCAGLVPRLVRDRESFLVLPIVRPGLAAVTGPTGLMASVRLSLGEERELESASQVLSALNELRARAVEQLAKDTTGDRAAVVPPTIVISIDQAEELFGANNEEGQKLCELLESAAEADSRLVLVATIRTDSYERMQRGWLAGQQLVFPLPPLASGSFQNIIEGPAKLCTPPLAVEATLTERLLQDISTPDALPLLAFALERLFTEYGHGGKLTLDAYVDKLGGLSGVFQTAVAAVLGPNPSKKQLDLAKRLFLPALVQVDQDGVKRRVARTDEIPEDTRELAQKFVLQRILLTNGDTLEVAHEAILRQWPRLSSWISSERSDLRTLDGLKVAANDWENHKRGNSWLIHRGDRLAAALAVARRNDFAPLLGPKVTRYLRACEAELAKKRRGAVAAMVFAGVVAVAAFAGGIGAFAANVLRERQQVADELYQQWLGDLREEQVDAAAVEAIAIRLSGIDVELTPLREQIDYYGLALQTFDADQAMNAHGGPDYEINGETRQSLVSARQDAVERAEELSRSRAELENQLVMLDVEDSVIAVALYYNRVYEVVSTNGVDRRRLSEQLGEDARLWAGIGRQGTAFTMLDDGAEGNDATKWLRERAILGAHFVARDFEDGAPTPWLQLLGINESDWQREEVRERERRSGGMSTSSP